MSERTYPENVSKNGENLNKTAKQLEEEMLVKPDPNSTTQFEPFYRASAEQLQTYRTQLLREQREICAKSLDWADVALHGQLFAETTIKNAPEP